MSDMYGDESPIEGETKRCTVCEKEKPLREFTVRADTGCYFTLCKRCRALRAAFNRDTEKERIAKAKYRATHREQSNAYRRARYHATKRVIFSRWRRIDLPTATCARCHNTYPTTAEYWGSNASKPGQLASYCRGCCRELKAQWRRKLKRERFAEIIARAWGEK
jgi:hypothetical protein